MAPRSDFLPWKWFLWNIELIRFRMLCHMTTLAHLSAKWSFWPLIAKNNGILTTILEFDFNVYFWVLQITSFLLIYSKPYKGSKFKIRISESIGRFFLTRFPGHVTRKREKGKNIRMRSSNENMKSEKTKIFHVRVARYVFLAVLIIWTISWPSDRFWNKRRK